MSRTRGAVVTTTCGALKVYCSRYFETAARVDMGSIYLQSVDGCRLKAHTDERAHPGQSSVPLPCPLNTAPLQDSLSRYALGQKHQTTECAK